jgi:uncharacterized protein (DUF169 family)
LPYGEISKLLAEGLNLAHTPIGLAFLQDAPHGVQRYRDAVPTACTFWKAAERAFFYATAEDHYNCPIGAITQGFAIPQPIMQDAKSLLEQMGKLDYFEAAEAKNIPTVKRDHKVVVYGPLKDFARIAVDVVLLICTPYQAMLISEATGAVAWEGGTPAPVLGRPACALIPSAMNRGAATSSMACAGARTFAGIGKHELLHAIPASRLPQLEQRLPTILAANAGMKDFYEARKAQFAPL